MAADSATAAHRKELLITYQSFRGEKNETALREHGVAIPRNASAAQAASAKASAKADMLLHMLRRTVGETAFAAAAAQLLRDETPPGWETVARAFKDAAPALPADFFGQWLDRPGLPSLTAKNIITRETDDAKVAFSFTLVQEQEKPYSLTVPVRITTPGEVVTREVISNAPKTEVSLVLSALPTELVIDPDYDVLRALNSYEYPLALIRFLGAANKLAVVPDDAANSAYEPLLSWLAAVGCETIPAGTAKDTAIAGRDILFVGTDTALVRGLFGRPDHPANGFTLDVRANPLGPEHVAVLISAADAAETAAAVAMLEPLAQYTFFHLKNGSVEAKSRQETDMGLAWWVDQPPTGVVLSERLGFDEIMARLHDTRVIYIGETHTRNEDHRLQLRVIRAMHRQSPKLAIGMEMFQRPFQDVLDAYVAGEISEWEFLKKSEYFKNWGFDYRFYRDIVNFARARRLPLLALNLDKGITNKVFKGGGVSALNAEELAKIPAERDLDVDGYRERIAGVFTMHGQHATPEQVNSFFQAQALWDETMAETAADFLKNNPEYRLAVVVGQGHATKDTAIPTRVARRLQVAQAVILSEQERHISPAEADYLIHTEPEPLPPAPILGVQLIDTDKGVQVLGLSPEGKAGEAGVAVGDYILALNNEPIGEVADLKIFLLYRNKGDSVQVKLFRPRKILADEILTVAVPL